MAFPKKMRTSIESLELRFLLSANAAGVYPVSAKSPLTLTDANGTTALFALLGPGTADLTVQPGTGDWDLNILSSTPRTALTITTTGGTGQVSIDRLTANPGQGLKSISAANVNVVQAFSIPVTSIVLNDVDAGAIVTLAGPSGKNSPVSFSANQVDAATLTASTPVTTLRVSQWISTTGSPGAFSAPSLSTLAVAGNIDTNITLTNAKATLTSGTVAGTASGTWSFAGNVGTLTIEQLRAQVSIAGNVRSTTVGDHVALLAVPSATGGTIHIGGTGKFSAPSDQFSVDNTTLYTCGAEMYSDAEISLLNHVGLTAVFDKQGKRVTSKIGNQSLTATGMTTFTDSYSDGSSETYAFDTNGAEFFVRQSDATSTTTYTGFQDAPARFTLGITYSYSGGYAYSENDNGSVFQTSGTVSATTVFAGHELVKTPAGSFVTVKLVETEMISASGVSPDGLESLSQTATAAGVELDSPAVGEVAETINANSLITISSLTSSTKPLIRKQRTHLFSQLLVRPTGLI